MQRLVKRSTINSATSWRARAGCVEPSAAGAATGTYTPLSRPLFIYVETTAAQRPGVKTFLKDYDDHQDSLTYAARFVPLSDEQKFGEQA